jgi:hypothetical protein
LQEDKTYFCSFIYSGTRSGAIFLNLKMIHTLIENNDNLYLTNSNRVLEWLTSCFK